MTKGGSPPLNLSGGDPPFCCLARVELVDLVDDGLGNLAHAQAAVHRGLLDPAERFRLRQAHLGGERLLARSTSLRVANCSCRSLTSLSRALISSCRDRAISRAGIRSAGVKGFTT